MNPRAIGSVAAGLTRWLTDCFACSGTVPNVYSSGLTPWILPMVIRSLVHTQTAQCRAQGQFVGKNYNKLFSKSLRLGGGGGPCGPGAGAGATGSTPGTSVSSDADGSSVDSVSFLLGAAGAGAWLR